MSLLPQDPGPANGLPSGNFYNTPAVPMRPQPPSAAGAQAAGGTDLIGPLLRRKFLILLFMVIGGVVGYLVYNNTPPTYQSSALLMVSSRSPAIIDGDIASVSKVSMPRQHRLLMSDAVLSKAIANGQFGNMKTFRESPAVMGKLVGSVLAVNYNTKSNDDTLQITATGEYQDELKAIVESVVAAYEQELVDQSSDSGRDNAQLITALHEKLQAEKEAANTRYYEILERLNIPGLEKNGTPTNPYVSEMDRLRQSRISLRGELRTVQGRLDSADRALESGDPNQINYLWTEAKKFLGVEIETIDTIGSKNTAGNSTQIITQMRARIFTLEQRLAELQSKKAAYGRNLGKKHPLMQLTDDSIEMLEEQLKVAKEEMETASQRAMVLDRSDEELKADLERRSRQWISIYHETLRAEQQRLEAEMAVVDEELKTIESSAKAISNDIAELQLLKGKIAELQSKTDEIFGKISQLNVVVTNFEDTKIDQIDPPNEAIMIGPSIAKFLGGGFLAGGMVGALLALLIDMADQTYRNPSEIYQKMGVPVLAKLPPFRMPKKTANGVSPALVTMHSPNSNAAEALRAVRTSILFAAQADHSKVLLFTSPSPGDGKTTTVVNLAVSMAQAGKSVVVVDADFRRPRIHAYYDMSLEPGVMQALSGTMELDECLQACPQYDDLSILCAGGRPANPGEIVTSQAFGDLIDTLRERFDFVFIDSPPVLPVADATMISSHVDSVYMIMRIRKGVAVTSTKAKEKLEMVHAPLQGVIVNGVDDNPHYNEYGSYGYAYGYNNVGNGKYYESRNSRYQEKIGSAS